VADDKPVTDREMMEKASDTAAKIVTEVAKYFAIKTRLAFRSACVDQAIRLWNESPHTTGDFSPEQVVAGAQKIWDFVKEPPPPPPP
jgi:hypothetical protein